MRFGADRAVDPLTENLVLQGYTVTQGKGFDVIFECSGRKGLIPEAMNLAGPAGTICQLSVLFPTPQKFRRFKKMIAKYYLAY